jgi:hypothetical protein
MTMPLPDDFDGAAFDRANGRDESEFRYATTEDKRRYEWLVDFLASDAAEDLTKDEHQSYRRELEELEAGE